MVLRLVLVSIVAGLGVSPPAEDELAGWSRTAQTWLDARLAEWNATQPLDRSESVASSVLAEDFDVAALESAVIDAFSALPEAVAVPGSVAVDRAGADVDFEAVVEAMVADFAPDATGTKPVASEVEAPVWSNAAARAEELEAEIIEAELDAGERAVEVGVAELDAGETNWCVPAPAMATLPAGEDVLFDSSDDCELLLHQGAGTEWTQKAAEPADPAPLAEEAPVSRDTAAPMADNSLRHAVRLTRDAAYAWWNLLQSPALVTVAVPE
jgi:hypothetical protein